MCNKFCIKSVVVCLFVGYSEKTPRPGIKRSTESERSAAEAENQARITRDSCHDPTPSTGVRPDFRDGPYKPHHHYCTPCAGAGTHFLLRRLIIHVLVVFPDGTLRVNIFT
ncbi:hypothetical protein AVEN_25973-1 [Araneus ventricosus]|uniref:Uncharacterized protein n=1 Tax=Araneus ventricosus TaxID=182803 RepID=A0A4Y2FGM9_ARAVE|nr:hypothetical protein AVEN_25973-1 [Araneus ventricosus]